MVNDPFLFLISSSAALILIVGIFWFFTHNISRRWQKHKAQTVELWEAEGVEFIHGPNGCQFGGLESTGAIRVIQGIGYVVLTAKDLRITRATPLKVCIIKYKQIKAVTIQPTYLGNKSKKTPFIVVRFSKGGEVDKLGFQVKTYEAWAEALTVAAKVRLKDLREA